MQRVIGVVRDRGGMGDLIRIGAVLDALRLDHPELPLHLCAPEAYRGLMMQGHCWALDRPGCRYVSTDGWPRRMSNAPLEPPAPRGGVRYVRLIDLNCPAKAHEQATRGSVTHERTALWCAAAGVPARQPRIHLNGDEEMMRRRFQMLARNAILVQPRSAALIRTWPRAECVEFGRRVLAAGHAVFWLDDEEEFVRGLPGFAIVGLCWDALVAFVASAPLMVAVDSGLFHLAAALGRPTLGLFGPTNGPLMCMAYPDAHYLQGGRASGCQCPCYAYTERGFGGEGCGAPNCASMATLRGDVVAAAALEMWRTRSRCA